jgi:hypothetical protein
MSFQLVFDLIILLLVLGVTTAALLGWGNLTWRFLSVEQPDRPSVLTVWLGFCIVVALIEIIHLFVPIDWRVTAAVAVIGLIGLNSRTRWVLSIKHYPLMYAVVGVVLVSWGLLAMQPPTMFDSGLYHFGSIRWLNEHAIVPGLGNLHWRLALNQSYFGFLALLNIAPYWGHGYAAGGLFLLALTALTLIEVAFKQSTLWRCTFGALLLSYLCLLSGQIANPLPDTAVALLQVVIFVLLYLSLPSQTSIEVDSTAVDSLHRLQIVLIFLCVTIVTIKLSSIGFAAASFAVICFSLYRGSSRQVPCPLLIKVGCLVGLFAAVHIGRSYLLSGTPFFPSPFGGVWSLTWAVPFGVASNESQLIYAWAKKPGINLVSDVPAGFGWVGAWLLALPQTMKYLFIVSSSLLVFALFLRRFVGESCLNKAWLLGAPILAALAFWFFTAPDPRFLGAIVVLYFAWALYIFAIPLKTLAFRYVGRAVKGTRTVIHLTVIAGIVVCFTRWCIPGVLYLDGWNPLPVPSCEVRVNPLGYKAFVPTTDTLCWNSELPCTFMLDDGLQRKPLSELGRWLSIQPDRFSLSIAR